MEELVTQLADGPRLTPEFFSRALAGRRLHVLEASPNTNGDPRILAEKYEQEATFPTGVFRYEIECSSDHGPSTRSVVVKSTPPVEGFVAMVSGILSSQGVVGDDLANQISVSDLSRSSTREIEAYGLLGSSETTSQLAPHCLGSYVDEDAGIFALVLEALPEAWLRGPTSDRADWVQAARLALMEQLGVLHGHFLGDHPQTVALAGAPAAMSAERMDRVSPLWDAVCARTNIRIGSALSVADYDQLMLLSDQTHDRWEAIDGYPKTIVHGDVQTKNIAIPPERAPMLFDWEVCTVHLPARDGIEFLISSLPVSALTADPDATHIVDLIERHRHATARSSGVDIDRSQWWHQYSLALDDYVTTRFALYLVIDDIEPHDIVRSQRVVRQLREVIGREVQR